MLKHTVAVAALVIASTALTAPALAQDNAHQATAQHYAVQGSSVDLTRDGYTVTQLGPAKLAPVRAHRYTAPTTATQPVPEAHPSYSAANPDICMPGWILAEDYSCVAPGFYSDPTVTP